MLNPSQTKQTKLRSALNNIMGAFADSAILLPMIAALALQTDYSSVTLLATSGLAYIVAGYLFRIPMPVQPLKSVVIAALAVGASKLEVQYSGVLVGGFCLLAGFLPWAAYLSKIPKVLIHGVQLSLGIILVLKGLELSASITSIDLIPSLSGFSPLLLILLMVAAIVLATEKLKFPLLGLIAIGGLLFGLFSDVEVSQLTTTQTVASEVSEVSGLRLFVILSLVLPQLVLTTANSVVGTVDVAKQYFGKEAYRVTEGRLFRTIGVGNLLMSVVGGLPYCHGSGGLTAHAKGGSSHWYSNLVIGIFLMVFAAVVAWQGSLSFRYPELLLAVMLVSVGLYHMVLAQRSWVLPARRVPLLIMAAVALFTRNLLLVMVAGLAYQLIISPVFLKKFLFPHGLNEPVEMNKK